MQTDSINTTWQVTCTPSPASVPAGSSRVADSSGSGCSETDKVLAQASRHQLYDPPQNTNFSS